MNTNIVENSPFATHQNFRLGHNIQILGLFRCVKKTEFVLE